MIILQIFLGIIWFALMVAAFVGTIFAVSEYIDNTVSEGVQFFARIVAIILGGIMALAIIAGLPFVTGIITFSDGSEHCGPGTVYHSATRMVGKTAETEWQCDPR